MGTVYTAVAVRKGWLPRDAVRRVRRRLGRLGAGCFSQEVPSWRNREALLQECRSYQLVIVPAVPLPCISCYTCAGLGDARSGVTSETAKTTLSRCWKILWCGGVKP